MSKIYQNDTNFQSRLLALMPVYGMRWVMIILIELESLSLSQIYFMKIIAIVMEKK